ncbi:hypothetical protein PGT21_012972 [Puccinia graminis f. sp. tritici]|uniref:Uncharacterized protein n=2 Tax=Puccinia graminis f. sp. tritici TaxID=56615 RepID=E3JX70_PUCGT|nr:uncharacterized protein PGTG_02106 [Puccinia graminis f. sp. tritici CRL 75-36-700-3]KAA1086142.1 hypothetical protein PGTUg99_010293 [Puccinia graminis f. sp. tritici]EFP76645.1 hypothetical protein PGTG_02106 [Puccinia graminis f. sp. tritici CRL 75-36-700-3]KAA1095127.1 hypothetical protein PGT21_035821 [Puccinia graminis f. sp. tritici]KAA1119027.1 hypothetical protein PGT21_012972 [Puccinia graminis f. sp. tritici]KAA1121393.1 hypothetical protein PGTUg99_019614 [Puccinia graminis f. s
MSESSSEHSSTSSILSDSPQPSSIRDHSDQGQTSPVSEISELSCKEVQALKEYSHSVQNFTYQLFEKFRLELEAKGRSSKSVTENDHPSNPSMKPNSHSKTTANVGFHSTDLMIENSPLSPSFNPANAQSNPATRRRKPSDYPRRKKRPGPDFPDHLGL